MEKKQKNLISIFLLVVGVIFILVAGGIFVTTAWKYLPVFVKQLALLVVAGGMFGGSYALSKNEKLGWISETLFHLGNAFVGFFVIAIMGGVVENNVVGNAFKVLAASGAMAIPVGTKLLVKRGAIDFAALSLLVDGILISGCIACETTINTYMYLLAGFVIGLAVIDTLQQKAKKQDGFSLCVGITYLLHASVYVLLSGMASLASIDNGVDDKLVIDSILWLGVVVAISTLSWMVRRHVLIRLFNSAISVWFTFITVNGIYNLLSDVENFSFVMVFTMVLVTVLMVWLRRVEITSLMIAAAIVIPFGQLFCYWMDALISIFDGVEKTWSTAYHPYSFIVGVGMFALYIVEYGCEDIFIEWKESKLLKFAGLQLATGCVMWFASKMTDSWAMVFYLLVAINMLLVVTVLKNNTAKRVFQTMAMFAVIFATSVQPFVEIPKAFHVEWICFLIAMGIVLFRFIWYDKKEQFSIVYFIATCVILGVLLISNLASGGLGNVLILGMTGIVMLVTAAITNNKKYVVASSVTLIILVLYLTREFWLSIAWWVYLFAAGVGLVLLAVKKAKEA
ncbi:MAG: hypothetical protein J6C01_01250 [Lachnospiraceae bacterium]|nr:hypothetical protein [Lachnospiraceae bacterium]